MTKTSVHIRVRGQVQGVGFRPFVWQLAQRLGVEGEVLNDPQGVLIRCWADDPDTFAQAIRGEAPPLARVDAIEITHGPAPDAAGFHIAASEGSGAETRVTPDAASCLDCLREVLTPTERRFGYPFTNCTHCGPRFTIVTGLPYDRAQTTMAPFDLCPLCRAEYENPADRRFHAQPVACGDCGPKVWIEPAGGDDPIQAAADRLRQGQVLAVKGLGGFHLAVDATQPEAIATLRARKHRPGKPFALMASLKTIERYADLTQTARDLLTDPAAPIVLLPKAGAPLPDGLAPGIDALGWMLPNTPLHHLLLRAVGGPLVMTSGNLSGEPQVIGNDEARQKLAGFVDGFLLHDREIARRMDDSVERADPPMVLRRARGRVPGTLPVPDGFPDGQVVAYGGQMKGALCLVKNGQALLGHHLGDLDGALTWDAFLQADADYTALFDHAPTMVAVDQHPDFRPSRHGADRAESAGLRLIEVQHHHAHLASCLAENGWPLDGGPVAGIILDGLGLGPDGTVWGGELLLGDYRDYTRHAFLTRAPLVGGDRAQSDPWRNALVRLDQAGLSGRADQMFSHHPVAMLRMAAEKGVNAPLSSSAGRLFDAVAAILGLCPDRQSYEGEAAMRLEALARQGQPHDHLRWQSSEGAQIDPTAMIRGIVTGAEANETVADLGYAFHRWLAENFARLARALVLTGHAQAVALSGGCFQNALLHRLCVEALGDVPVLTHATTPANDGGLALGQAMVALAQA